MKLKSCCLLILGILGLTACQDKNKTDESFYGTTEAFASEAVYFVMTDRFVDGDPSNNQIDQGGEHPTFQLPLIAKDGRRAYVGYMGGDFKGILNNADYIKSLGFTSIWLTPIVDQPDEAFAGGEPIEFGGAFKDGGKTGYHGYWGVNFFKVDEHLPSKDLSFKQLTENLRNKYQIKTVLDVVTNHGSPAFSMPKQQPRFGQLFDQQGRLIADHENLEPENLDANNPLHQFYNHQKDIAQLSDFNFDNPDVLNYFVSAYSYWIEQGADAFRIDTIKHMPHSFWKKFSDGIRTKHPNFFMFAESYSFDADFIAQHTLNKNGGVSVLDFPGREVLLKTFEKNDSDYRDITSYLRLTHGPYANPYELMTFYDNHDMPRMNANDNGFIDAHNWLFTSRGIPVIYYGSEMGFMAGSKEHEGNRNYFGQENIEKAKVHPIKRALEKIANVRKSSIALQKGLQVNLPFTKNTAAFYRVYQHQGINQTALILLNKGDGKAEFSISQFMQSGQWENGLTGDIMVLQSRQPLVADVAAHSVSVYLLNETNNDAQLLAAMRELMWYK